MAGFFVSLCFNDINAGKAVFEAKNLSVSFEKKISSFTLIKFRKLLLTLDEFIYESGEHVIVASGTLSYRSLDAKSGFERLCKDILNGVLENAELFGHYTIVHIYASTVKLYFDEAGYGAPYVIQNKFISSSFLACCELSESLSLNQYSIFRTIYTGLYDSEDTTFHEIRKINKKECWNIENIKVEFIPIIQKIETPELTSQREGVTYQLNELSSYMRRWKPQVEKYSGDIGLSSGYDSRLMVALLVEHNPGAFQVHSYWKEVEDFDNIIAKEIAKTIGLVLVGVPVKNRNNLAGNEFEGILKNAFLYYDGIFPSNHGWVREYRTSLHRSKILGSARFGFSGISGEQYRNDFNLLNKKYKIEYVIENILLEDFNHIVLRNSTFSYAGMEHLRDWVGKRLIPNGNRTMLSKEDILRMYCEMWVPGGPGLRNRMENTLSFFVSPFTERKIQHSAYASFKYLGVNGQFQASMINRLNPNLAAILSDYGYPFTKIPLAYILKSYLSGFVGRKTIAALRKAKNSKYLDTFGKHRANVEAKLYNLNQYGLSFPIKSDLFKQDTYDRLIALSMLLNEYSNKIRL
ncbi:MAG TPA: hypothetical protein VD884_05990 [Ohtaekwangia sp.]|nr:hypothetical protein [Ohtaekwangia sp.]